MWNSSMKSPVPRAGAEVHCTCAGGECQSHRKTKKESRSPPAPWAFPQKELVLTVPLGPFRQ